MRKKIAISTLLSVLLLSLAAVKTYAVCPVCTVAVVAGLGLSRWLGIDDTISGVWIGGLILSSSFWLIDFLKRKKPELPIANFQFPIIFIMFLFVFVPLQIAGITGHPFNKLWGIDKLLLGSIMGSGVFLVGIVADKVQRRVKGKQFFPFQKVVFPVLSLIIMSIIFAVVTKK